MQGAFMQQILNAQKHSAHHLTLPGTDKPIITATVKGLLDSLLQPEQKRLEEAARWNDQQTTNSLPQLKSEGFPPEPGFKDEPGAPALAESQACSSMADPATAGAPFKNLLMGRLVKRRGRPRPSPGAPRGKRRQFCCSYCSYSSVRRYNTERHIRLRHPSYRFKCPVETCGMILLDETEYRVHIECHSGVAFFLRCRECGAPCGDYDTLIAHQRNCGAIQGSVDLSAVETQGPVPDGEEEGGEGGGGSEEVGGAEGGVSSGLHDDSPSSAGEGSRFVIRLESETVDSEDRREAGGEEGEGEVVGQESSPEIQQEGQATGNDGVRSDDCDNDDDDSVEVVEDDNLPIHFMVKEEKDDSSASCS